MFDDTVNFPFFISFDYVCGRFWVSRSMDVVFVLRSEEDSMEYVIHFPVWREFKAIGDRF